MRGRNCLSSWTIEQIAEPRGWPLLPSEDAVEHAETCPSCAASVADVLEREMAFRLEIYPATVGDLKKRLGVRESKRTFLWISSGFAAAAAAALVAIVVVPSLRDDSAPTPETEPSVQEAPATYVGLKGNSAMTLYVKRGAEVFRHASGGTLMAGDVVRVVPAASGWEYVMLVSRDARGTVQLVYPWDGSASARLPQPGKPLVGAFQLDDVDGEEKLVALFSSEPVAARDALGLVRGQGDSLQSGRWEFGATEAEVVVVDYLKVAP